MLNRDIIELPHQGRPLVSIGIRVRTTGACGAADFGCFKHNGNHGCRDSGTNNLPNELAMRGQLLIPQADEGTAGILQVRYRRQVRLNPMRGRAWNHKGVVAA